MSDAPTKQERNIAAARAWAVLAFLAAAGFALLVALIEATMEGDDDWGDRTPRGLIVFALANAVAAGLAGVQTQSTARPLLAPLILIPAVLFMNEHKGNPSDGAWLLVAGASGLVVMAGLVAGDLWTRVLREREP